MNNIIIVALILSVVCAALSVIYTAFSYVQKQGFVKLGCFFFLISVLTFGFTSFLVMDSNNNVRGSLHVVQEGKVDESVAATTVVAQTVPGTLGMNPHEFMKQFNEASKNLDSNVLIKEFPIVKGWTQDSAKYIFSDALSIIALVNKADGSIREVTLLYIDKGYQSKLDFINASASLSDVFQPNLSGKEKGNIATKLHLHGIIEDYPDYSKMQGTVESGGFV